MKHLFPKRKTGQPVLLDTVSTPFGLSRCLPTDHPDYGKAGRTISLHNYDMDLRVIVDDGDYELSAGDTWAAKNVDGVFYAWNDKRGWMHEFLFLVPPKQFLYHRNGNGLDNRSNNIFLSFGTRAFTKLLSRDAVLAPLSGRLNMPHGYAGKRFSKVWKQTMGAE